MATLRYGIVPYVAILGVIAALMAKEPHLSGMVLLLGIFCFGKMKGLQADWTE